MTKVLIANRGEIAVRIMKTARRLGIKTVAIYSEVDIDSRHVEMADEAYCLGHSALADTYLNTAKIIAVAKDSFCDAIHPGYGFLSENPSFVTACQNAGLIFIGPDSNVMHVMGNKIEARNFAASIGIPITSGLTGTPSSILEHADEIGFPLLVKTAAEGGGKGMRIVRSKENLIKALESTSREAANYFADGTVYVEKFVENPRHIEIQLIGDQHGNVIHLFERECSIQRRYQKIIEEAPSPTLNPAVRSQMGDAAVAIGKAIGYQGAGTIEFLVDASLQFYFLEMNTRIQVEHPVTEMTTGIDIVEEQIRIASGEPLRFKQEDLKQKGHAIECRIYAEDPENGFLPSPGKMNLYHEPSGANIRVDSGIAGKPVIQSFFDPMISKLIVFGEDRESARHGMIDALNNYVIHGIKNNISFLHAILEHKEFIDNQISTKYCDEYTTILIEEIKQKMLDVDIRIPLFAGLIGSLQKAVQADSNTWDKIGYWRIFMHLSLQIGTVIHKLIIREFSRHQLKLIWNSEETVVDYHCFPDGKTELIVGNQHHLTWLSQPEPGKILVNSSGITFEVTRLDLLPPQPEFSGSEGMGASNLENIISPMPGKVIKICVTEGQAVTKGDLLLVVEAMKMENNIVCPGEGIVDRINVSVGELVDGNTKLIHVKENE
ncbi:MAG: acetyl-CoA carboxylase biotin carboxylase subunit [Bacteroidales bacterium]|nr:acetyl-CoA carboxylase biotin carboxylase subunit [Bacteroidales bacterium]